LENLAFTPDDIANCREVFNKNKIVFNYLWDKKSLLKKKLIEQKLTKIGYEKITKAEYDKLSADNQQKLIEKIESNDEYMKDINSYVETKFSTVAIWQATQNLTAIQYDPTTTVENINNPEVSDETGDVLADVSKEKQDLLGDMSFDEMEEKMENGTFDRD
jgi:hypothetical protein